MRPPPGRFAKTEGEKINQKSGWQKNAVPVGGRWGVEGEGLAKERRGALTRFFRQVRV